MLFKNGKGEMTNICLKWGEVPAGVHAARARGADHKVTGVAGTIPGAPFPSGACQGKGS